MEGGGDGRDAGLNHPPAQRPTRPFGKRLRGRGRTPRAHDPCSTGIPRPDRRNRASARIGPAVAEGVFFGGHKEGLSLMSFSSLVSLSRRQHHRKTNGKNPILSCNGVRDCKEVKLVCRRQKESMWSGKKTCETEAYMKCSDSPI